MSTSVLDQRAVPAPRPAVTRPRTGRHARTPGNCFCGATATQAERASIGYRGEPIIEWSCDQHSTDQPGIRYVGWGEVENRPAPTPAHRAPRPPARRASRLRRWLR